MHDYTPRGAQTTGPKETYRIGFRVYAALTSLMLGMGALGGIFFAYTVGSATNADIARHFEEKNTLRAQCVAGNDRACRMYEVDYGR